MIEFGHQLVFLKSVALARSIMPSSIILLIRCVDFDHFKIKLTLVASKTS